MARFDIWLPSTFKVLFGMVYIWTLNVSIMDATVSENLKQASSLKTVQMMPPKMKTDDIQYTNEKSNQKDPGDSYIDTGALKPANLHQIQKDTLDEILFNAQPKVSAMSFSEDLTINPVSTLYEYVEQALHKDGIPTKQALSIPQARERTGREDSNGFEGVKPIPFISRIKRSSVPQLEEKYYLTDDYKEQPLNDISSFHLLGYCLNFLKKQIPRTQDAASKIITQTLTEPGQNKISQTFANKHHLRALPYAETLYSFLKYNGDKLWNNNKRTIFISQGWAPSGARDIKAQPRNDSKSRAKDRSNFNTYAFTSNHWGPLGKRNYGAQYHKTMKKMNEANRSYEEFQNISL